MLKICRKRFCKNFNKSQWQDTNIARELVSKVVPADCKVVPVQFLQIETSVCSDEPTLARPYPGPTPPELPESARSCTELPGFMAPCGHLHVALKWRRKAFYGHLEEFCGISQGIL